MKSILRISRSLFKNSYTASFESVRFASPNRSFNLFNGQMKISHEEQVAEQKKRNEEVQEMTELIRDFLDPADFFNSVKTVAGIDFFCGVPDSLLKDFCAYVTENVSSQNHIITTNEGQAIGLAAGYHMATGKYPLVYLQNSGLGNVVNPIMSLATPNVFSVPMLLMMGWRGEPGKRDEPQHLVQGQFTPGVLAALGIPFQTLPDYQEGAEQALASAKHYLDVSKGPYCLLIRRQTFLPYNMKKKQHNLEMNREEALGIVLDSLTDKDVVVGSTGMLSREIFEYRKLRCQGYEKDFLTIGSMGHCSVIALGVALFKPRRQVYCLDGDGSVLMHMGAMASIGQNGTSNLKHVIFNNGVHDSVGGQPTIAGSSQFSFPKIAIGCGYKNIFSATTKDDLIRMVKELKVSNGPSLLEIKCNPGHRKNLGRPKQKPVENKKNFMHFLAISS